MTECNKLRVKAIVSSIFIIIVIYDDDNNIKIIIIIIITMCLMQKWVNLRRTKSVIADSS